MPKCRECNAEIQWVEMKDGSQMPLDMTVRVVITPVSFSKEDRHGKRTPLFGAIKGFASHFVTCKGKKKS